MADTVSSQPSYQELRSQADQAEAAGASRAAVLALRGQAQVARQRESQAAYDSYHEQQLARQAGSLELAAENHAREKFEPGYVPGTVPGPSPSPKITSIQNTVTGQEYAGSVQQLGSNRVFIGVGGAPTKTPLPSKGVDMTGVPSLNLFDPSVRASVQQNIRGGLYGSAGDVIKGKINPQYTPEARLLNNNDINTFFGATVVPPANATSSTASVGTTVVPLIRSPSPLSFTSPISPSDIPDRYATTPLSREFITTLAEKGFGYEKTRLSASSPVQEASSAVLGGLYGGAATTLASARGAGEGVSSFAGGLLAGASFETAGVLLERGSGVFARSGSRVLPIVGVALGGAYGVGQYQALKKADLMNAPYSPALTLAQGSVIGETLAGIGGAYVGARGVQELRTPFVVGSAGGVTRGQLFGTVSGHPEFETVLFSPEKAPSPKEVFGLAAKNIGKEVSSADFVYGKSVSSSPLEGYVPSGKATDVFGLDRAGKVGGRSAKERSGSISKAELTNRQYSPKFNPYQVTKTTLSPDEAVYTLRGKGVKYDVRRGEVVPTQFLKFKEGGGTGFDVVQVKQQVPGTREIVVSSRDVGQFPAIARREPVIVLRGKPTSGTTVVQRSGISPRDIVRSRGSVLPSPGDQSLVALSRPVSSQVVSSEVVSRPVSSRGGAVQSEYGVLYGQRRRSRLPLVLEESGYSNPAQAGFSRGSPEYRLFLARERLKSAVAARQESVRSQLPAVLEVPRVPGVFDTRRGSPAVMEGMSRDATVFSPRESVVSSSFARAYLREDARNRDRVARNNRLGESSLTGRRPAILYASSSALLPSTTTESLRAVDFKPFSLTASSLAPSSPGGASSFSFTPTPVPSGPSSASPRVVEPLSPPRLPFGGEPLFLDRLGPFPKLSGPGGPNVGGSGRRAKQHKRHDRLFAYTPTLLGTDFTGKSSPFAVKSGLVLRPVQLNTKRR